MIAPYEIARISRPCPFVSVNTSTGRPSGRRPNAARVTIGGAPPLSPPRRACPPYLTPAGTADEEHPEEADGHELHQGVDEAHGQGTLPRRPEHHQGPRGAPL